MKSLDSNYLAARYKNKFLALQTLLPNWNRVYGVRRNTEPIATALVIRMCSRYAVVGVAVVCLSRSQRL